MGMSAQELTLGLRLGRWCGDYGTACCPAHDDHNPSLRVSEGDDGRPLVFCNAGCEQQSVISALRSLGLWDRRADVVSIDPAILRRREEEKAKRKAEGTRIANALWGRSGPIEGTPAETYLVAARGLTGPFSPTIRYNPSARHRATDQYLPCMVAAVSIWPSRAISGVQRTYLRGDGGGKAQVDPTRAMLGVCRGGAVRLAPAGPVLAVCEGIETGLSCQLATGLPVWAALTTSGLKSLALPDLPLAERVVLFADRDRNGAGQRAAEIAAERFLAEGRRVRIVLPPEPFNDFNDVWTAETVEESAA